MASVAEGRSSGRPLLCYVLILLSKSRRCRVSTGSARACRACRHAWAFRSARSARAIVRAGTGVVDAIREPDPGEHRALDAEQHARTQERVVRPLPRERVGDLGVAARRKQRDRVLRGAVRRAPRRVFRRSPVAVFAIQFIDSVAVDHQLARASPRGESRSWIRPSRESSSVRSRCS